MGLNNLATNHHPTWQIYTAEIRCAFLQQVRVPLQFLSVPLGVISPYAAFVIGSRFFEL